MKGALNELQLSPHSHRQAPLGRRRLVEHLVNGHFLPRRVVQVQTLRVTAYHQSNPPIGLFDPLPGLVIAPIPHHHVALS